MNRLSVYRLGMVTLKRTLGHDKEYSMCWCFHISMVMVNTFLSTVLHKHV